MMEKVIKFILAAVALGGIMYVFNSFAQSPEDKQEEAYAYVMTINDLNKKQQRLVNDYTVRVAKAEDPEKGYAYLDHTLIPAYQAFQKEVAMVKPLNEELEAVYLIYKNAVNEQLTIYEEYSRAYKEQAVDVYQKTNGLLEENNKHFAEHEAKMQALAKEYAILLKTD